MANPNQKKRDQAQSLATEIYTTLGENARRPRILTALDGVRNDHGAATEHLVRRLLGEMYGTDLDEADDDRAGLAVNF